MKGPGGEICLTRDEGEIAEAGLRAKEIDSIAGDLAERIIKSYKEGTQQLLRSRDMYLKARVSCSRLKQREREDRYAMP